MGKSDALQSKLVVPLVVAFVGLDITTIMIRAMVGRATIPSRDISSKATLSRATPSKATLSRAISSSREASSKASMYALRPLRSSSVSHIS